MSTTFRCGLLLMLVCSAALLLSSPASAQYFGRNKVQYRTFKFEVLKTEHFDIYFYPEEKAGVEIAARMAERWHSRLRRLLRHELNGRQPLILYASHVDFEQTNVIGGEIGEGTGGVTEPIARRIVLPLAGPLAETDHVIGHELVHAFQFDMTTLREAPPGMSGLDRLPLWFVEGMAEYLSIGPNDPNTAMWLRDAARRERLPAIKDLADPEYFPYRWGQAFWSYVAGRFGDQVIPQLLRLGAAMPYDKAIEQVLGVSLDQLSKDWHAAIQKSAVPVLLATGRELVDRRPIVQGREFKADLNVGPALSPDGRWLAFLSSQSLLSIDVFIADAASGQIVRKLTSTATNAHFSSIQFIYSAGAWDRASRRLAIATVASGKPALAIYDTRTGNLDREIRITEVDEILAPAWAPDDTSIAFSGMSGGLTDLYIYDLRDSRLRRLTTDVFAELQPAWSPDGRRIAFATDRFTSDMATLSFVPYGLAIIDVESGHVERVQADTKGKGKAINPQWSPDGESLYFISDRDGVSNVYRTGAGGGDTSQVTTIATGVSGITALSPALSVASRTGTLAFSVYTGGTYSIYALPGTAGGPPWELPLDAGALGPPQRRTNEVAALLENPSSGLPPPEEYPVEPYSGKLKLESVMQPTVGVGVSRFGTSLGGGIALAFSDTLRNHSLFTAVQMSSTFGNSPSVKDIGAQVAYLNSTHRWNWGVIGGQLPYLTGGFQSSVGRLPSGEPVQTDQMLIFRQTERSVSAVTSYPFGRARRIEFQGGVSSISFDQIVNTTTFSLVNGAVLQDTTVTTPIGETLQLGNASAAYVFDTAVVGATSPVQGQRYRFEVAPTIGTLAFTGLLTDYRRYFMPVPFYTIAVRAMHYGRYGRDAQDPRIFPLDVGYPWLVRGYDVGSIDSDDCVATPTSSCELLDRTTGSRMFVGNIELRFPLMRPFGADRGVYGPLPVEVALFADAGTAWNAGQQPAVLGGSRDGIASAGVGLRVNFFGFAVGEFDFSRPFQRPGRGWNFGFNLMPGW